MHYRKLGYSTYNEYLKGAEWSEIHQFFYQNCSPYRCRVCGKSRRLLLHKRSYEYLSMRSLRRKYIIKIIIVRAMRRLMCWLCRDCNRLIHFYDDGRRVPLEYSYLLRREKEIIKRQRSWLRKFIQVRPSDILRAISRLRLVD